MPLARYVIRLDGEDFPPVADLGSAAYTEATVQRIAVATGTSNQSIDFGGVTTADIVYIKSDQGITYKVNGGSDSNTLDAGKPVIYAGTAVTGLTVSNSSGATANILIILIGA